MLYNHTRLETVQRKPDITATFMPTMSQPLITSLIQSDGASLH